MTAAFTDEVELPQLLELLPEVLLGRGTEVALVVCTGDPVQKPEPEVERLTSRVFQRECLELEQGPPPSPEGQLPGATIFDVLEAEIPEQARRGDPEAEYVLTTPLALVVLRTMPWLREARDLVLSVAGRGEPLAQPKAHTDRCVLMRQA